MEYSKLVAVTGLPGLYELVNSKTDGAIVRSLEDNSTKFASSRIHNFSHLESIEVYTIRDNVNLVEIFYAMEEAGGSLPDGKDNSILKKYFEKVYPDLDFERVYASDLKKMVKWFEILKKQDIEIKLSEPIEEEPEVVEEEAEEVKEKKPAKKTAKKTARSEGGKEDAETKVTEEKPAKKKAATKKESTTSVKKEKEKEKEEAPNPPAGRAGKKAAPKKK
jgi:hypothetical protein